jgi:hypothetical protein
VKHEHNHPSDIDDVSGMHLVAAWNLLSATKSSRCTHLVIGIPACRQLFALHQEDPQPGHNRSTCPQRRPPGPPPA